jgi:hypothetical protein
MLLILPRWGAAVLGPYTDADGGRSLFREAGHDFVG